MIIDAKDTILGRLASFTAKKLLNGEKVIIINAQEIVISGRKEDILKKYKERRDKGDIVKGPFFPRTSDRIVRRSIRGMLPWHKAKGRNAFKNLRVYSNTPKNLKGSVESLKEYHVSNLKDIKFIRIKEISKWLGA